MHVCVCLCARKAKNKVGGTSLTAGLSHTHTHEKGKILSLALKTRIKRQIYSCEWKNVTSLNTAWLNISFTVISMNSAFSCWTCYTRQRIFRARGKYTHLLIYLYSVYWSLPTPSPSPLCRACMLKQRHGKGDVQVMQDLFFKWHIGHSTRGHSL